MKLTAVTAESEYTSVACNRTPGIVDWNSDGVMCFGASHAVVLYDTKVDSGDPLIVLCHHQLQVNYVKWLYNEQLGCSEIISCSGDKTAAVWSNINDQWQVTNTLKGHSDGVTCCDGVYLEEGLLIFTTSIDSTLRIWGRVSDNISCRQTIALGSGLCLTLKSHLLPMVKKPILLCALDDHKIHIFTQHTVQSDEIPEFCRTHILVGHEDWVRGLDVMNVDEGTIMLASSSQDTYIRLWKIQRHVPDEQPSNVIKIEQKLFIAYEEKWSVKLEAVLSGHEGWVYGVQWHPPLIDKDTNLKTPIHKLLSSSLDKTLIIWEPESADDSTDGVWVEKVRVGEVGGNGLGFYGSKFGPDGKSFMGHGYNGSFHIWKLDKELNKWCPMVVCGGHFGEVVDARWDPSGQYLASVSADQTTRLHAPWHRNRSRKQWHELARPQVHGYDMSSLAIVSSTVFVSGAEEKVIRAFKAPQNFLDNFYALTKQELVGNCTGGPEGATVPSLGLSNKAVFSGDNNDSELIDCYFRPVTLTEPPTEENLMQNTLWPEVQKLYGHGYEVFALAASPDGTTLASACRASSAEHAAILIWDTSNWQQVQKLLAHQLTVTQLAFSSDSNELLAVSRDRRWSLHRRSSANEQFELVASTDKSNGVHARIIWCCAWSHDDVVFATGSRDGRVCVWTDTGAVTQTSLGSYALVGKRLELKSMSVTALDFAPARLAPNRIIAVGFETGVIRLYNFVCRSDEQWNLLLELDNSAAHHLTVRRVSFKPHSESDETLRLATCGNDHLVRVYEITVHT